ncbi:Zinc transporter ZIP2 [Anthophora retusa]
MEEATTSTVLLVAKIGAMIGLGFGSLLLGMLPLIVGRYRLNHRQKRHHGISSNSSTCTSTSVSNASSSSVISRSAADSQGLQTSLLLCFGGGVLLFTTFLHLAPEVRISVERHQRNGQLPTLGTLSLSELLFCAGFFLVYFVEEAVHAALTGKPESSEALLYRTVSVRRCNNQAGASTAVSTGSTTTVSTTIRSTWKEGNDDLDDSENDLNKRSIQQDLDDLRDGKQDKMLPAIFVLSSPTGLSSTEHSPQNNMRHPSDAELNHYPRMKHHEHKHPVITKNTSVQGLLTVLALSFHAIFEGLAVGLEPSIGSVVYLAAAIATHKLVISFCVGMELYVAGATTKTTLGYLTIFSMVTPIGIAVGLALGHFKNDSENLGPTPTILQGMAAGTLLYVVFFEVLARERANEKSGLLQLTAIIIGFMLMLGLQITTAHSHSHSHSHSSDGHAHVHGHEVKYNHEDDHDHELDSHESVHTNKTGEQILTDTIDRITESITEAVSNILSSTMKTPTDATFRSSNNETASYTNRS